MTSIFSDIERNHGPGLSKLIELVFCPGQLKSSKSGLLSNFFLDHLELFYVLLVLQGF